MAMRNILLKLQTLGTNEMPLKQYRIHVSKINVSCKTPGPTDGFQVILQIIGRFDIYFAASIHICSLRMYNVCSNGNAERNKDEGYIEYIQTPREMCYEKFM